VLTENTARLLRSTKSRRAWGGGGLGAALCGVTRTAARGPLALPVTGEEATAALIHVDFKRKD